MSLSFLASHPEGVVLEVWVSPGSARRAISGVHDGAIRVRVAVPAEHGHANHAVVELLVSRLGGQSGEVLSGARSRRKRVLVRGVTTAGAEKALQDSG